MRPHNHYQPDEHQSGPAAAANGDAPTPEPVAEDHPIDQDSPPPDQPFTVADAVVDLRTFSSSLAAAAYHRLAAIATIRHAVVAFVIIAGHIAAAAYHYHQLSSQPSALDYTASAATLLAYTTAWALVAIYAIARAKARRIRRLLAHQQQADQLIQDNQ